MDCRLLSRLQSHFLTLFFTLFPFDPSPPQFSGESKGKIEDPTTLSRTELVSMQTIVENTAVIKSIRKQCCYKGHYIETKY